MVNPTSVPKVDTTNPEIHISEQDPNILNLMVSHYDCAKQNNLGQFREHLIHKNKIFQH